MCQLVDQPLLAGQPVDTFYDSQPRHVATAGLQVGQLE